MTNFKKNLFFTTDLEVDQEAEVVQVRLKKID